jgi:hypothetical protein
MRVPLRVLLALALALMLAAAPCPARVTPNPAGRVVLDPSGPRREPLRTSATTALPVGLTPGAVALDSTWYDLQDMGSLGHHIEVGPDGRVHVTWQDDLCELSGQCPPNLNLPQPYPFRGQVYAYRDVSGIWHNTGKVQDPRVAGLRCCAAPEEFGGFGTIALTPSGRAIVSQHMNEDSCDLHGNFYLEDAPGGSAWTSYLSPISGGSSFLFPQAAITPTGGVTLLGEVPVAGVYDETVQIGTSWFPTTGTLYTCFNWQGQAWSNLVPGIVPASLFRDGRPAFPSLAASSNGRVGVAVGDFGGNVYLIESSNGTFAANTITIRNLTGTTDAQVTAGDSTSTEFRAYIHCHLAYNDTTPNVVWSELQARRVGGVVSFFDWHSRIRHWSPDRGVGTVYQVPAGVADHFDDVDNGLNGPLGGFNSLAVDWPQVGFSDDGSETYVVWQRCVDGEVDATADMGLTGICTGVGFADLACSVARGGQGWSAAEDLTNTPRTDERFFSLATRNPGGRLHLVYQASATDQAGCALIGDRGTAPGNLLRRIAYLEVRPAASVLAVGDGGPASVRAPGALRVAPNPVFGAARVTFAATADPNPARRVEVYALDGRRVVSLPYARSVPVIWDGRDDTGHRVPAGVYFARLSDTEANHAVRFVLAH